MVKNDKDLILSLVYTNIGVIGKECPWSRILKGLENPRNGRDHIVVNNRGDTTFSRTCAHDPNNCPSELLVSDHQSSAAVT